MELPQPRAPTARLAEESPIEEGVDDLFLAWFRPFRGKFTPEVEAIVYEAFKAGYQVKAQLEPLKGTAESRTISAALSYFLENILRANPEEVQTGEWLTPREVEQLILRFQKG